ncbi:hypothetical protein M0805_006319 [Coniferiporia weirii]|nr:hypothetical protein M0805_006319 [Coniferiporia weirii]
MYTLLAGIFLLFCAVRRLTKLLKSWRNVSDCIPRLLTPIQPLSTPGFFLPKTPFYRIVGFNWDERHSLYEKSPLKTLAIMPILYGETFIYSSSAPSFHQNHNLTSAFFKPANSNQSLRMLGENVLSAEGNVWKRHRRITAPAFNHATYRNVWNTTACVYADMLENEGWRNVGETLATDVNKITHKLALFLISIVGFGIPMSWSEPSRDENGKLSVQEMIFQVADNIVERTVIPRWAYFLGIKKLTEIDEAYTRFEEFMQERISEREAELKKVRAMEGASESSVGGGIKDVFGLLVNARLSGGKLSLSDEEIIGNCFVFTFAGHETTANTLAATLALLAIYPDEQEWVYQSIKDVLGDREPTFEDFDDLDGVLACFYEGLRLFPAAYLIVRKASKDTSLDLPRRDNPDVVERIPVKEGSILILDMVAMCYDPDTFPDPEAFNPRRWSKSSKPASFASTSKATQADEVTGSSPISTLEGFIGFSYGPRTCIGHKFAKVEAVAFLTLLLREWRIVPVMNVGESRDDWRSRILKPAFGQALLIGNVPLKLMRRNEKCFFFLGLSVTVTGQVQLFHLLGQYSRTMRSCHMGRSLF